LDVISRDDKDFGGIRRQELTLIERVSLMEMKLLEMLDFGVIIGEMSLKKGENFFCLELSIWFYEEKNVY